MSGIETVNKYRIYCSTDSKYEYAWGETTPTVCPTDTAHTIDSASITIVTRVEPGENGMISPNNSKLDLATVAYNLHDGKVVASATNTVTLATGASATDDIYNNYVIEIIAGTGARQAREITDYNGTTKVATLGANWITPPDTTSVYVIYANSGTVQSAKRNTITLATTASAVNDIYKYAFIRIENGSGCCQLRRVKSYDGATKIATLDNAWDVGDSPSTGSLYAIFGESGTATAGATSTITLDGNQLQFASAPVAKAGHQIDICTGTGSGQIREIKSISGNVVTMTEAWDTAPDATSVYHIFGGWGGTFEDVNNYSEITNSFDINSSSGESMVAVFRMSFNSTGTLGAAKYVEIPAKSAVPIHTLAVISQYYKNVLVSLGYTVTGGVHVTYHKSKSKNLTFDVGGALGDQQDIELTRSVIAGRTLNGEYKNISSDPRGYLNMSIQHPVSSLGEVSTQQLTPVGQVSFIYGIHERDTVSLTSYPTVVEMITEGTASVAQVQRIFLPDGAGFTSTGNADYFTLVAGDTTSYYVWFDVEGGNTDPAPGGTGIEVDILSNDTASQVATSARTAINSDAKFTASIDRGNIVRITNVANGAVESIGASNMPSTPSSTITESPPSADLKINTGIGDYAILRTRRKVSYRAGLGSMCRVSGKFNAGVTGSVQYMGLFNSISILAFGYTGTTFGILRRSKAKMEIRELKITTAANGNQTATVTINGIDFSIALTAGTTSHNAHEIASHNFNTINFATEQVGNSVYFISKIVGPKSVAYVFSSTGNAVASFSRVTAGVAKTETWTSQDEWNIDRMDGFGASGMLLNSQLNNIYQIDMHVLGAVTFSVEDSKSGTIVPVHKIKYANSSSEHSVIMPHFHSGWAVSSITSTTAMTLNAEDVALFVQGKIRHLDPIYSTNGSITTSSANQFVLMTVKSATIFNGLPNLADICLRTLNLLNSSTGNVQVDIYRNGDLSGGSNTNYSFAKKNKSAILVDSSATSVTGDIIVTKYLSPTSNATINLVPYGLTLQQGETLTIAITRIGATDVTVNASLTWIEDQ